MAAAVFGLLVVGLIYFNAQSLLLSIVVSISSIAHSTHSQTDSYLDVLLQNVMNHRKAVQAVIVVTQFLFMLVPTVVLVKRWHTREVREYLMLKRADAGAIVLGVVITLMIIPSSVYIANAFTSFLHIPRRLLEVNEAMFRADSLPEFAWMVGVVAVTPAICEELFFRGYVQRTMERSIGSTSVIIIGVLFGLYHLQPLGLISLSILGLVFGYLFYRSKSLFPSMAAHFTNNFVIVLIAYVKSPVAVLDFRTARQMPLVLVVPTLCFGGVALYAFHVITQKNFPAVNAGAGSKEET